MYNVFHQILSFRKREEIKESLREEYELDLALQLKRQAQAHSLHLVDELESKETSLTAQFNERIENEINSLVNKYDAQIERGLSYFWLTLSFLRARIKIIGIRNISKNQWF